MTSALTISTAIATTAVTIAAAVAAATSQQLHNRTTTRYNNNNNNNDYNDSNNSQQQQQQQMILAQLSASDFLIVALLITLILISIVGNCLVCVAIFTDRRLRKLGNAFIVSLAIADLFVSCLVMTFALCNDLMQYWIFGEWFCDVWISFDIMCSTASILNLCAISLDRFVHIKDCLLYNQWMTRRVAISAVMVIWFISALVSFVPINLGWHKPDHQWSLSPTSSVSTSKQDYLSGGGGAAVSLGGSMEQSGSGSSSSSNSVLTPDSRGRRRRRRRQQQRQDQFNQVEFNPQDGSSGLAAAAVASGFSEPTAAKLNFSSRTSAARAETDEAADEWLSQDPRLSLSSSIQAPNSTLLLHQHNQNLNAQINLNLNLNQNMQNQQQPTCALSLTPTYAIISSSISFYIPCIIMLGLYTKLFACARRHVRNIQAISKAPAPILPASRSMVQLERPTAGGHTLIGRQLSSDQLTGCHNSTTGPAGTCAPPVRTWLKFATTRLTKAKQQQQVDSSLTSSNSAAVTATERNAQPLVRNNDAQATTTTTTTIDQTSNQVTNLSRLNEPGERWPHGDVEQQPFIRQQQQQKAKRPKKVINFSTTTTTTTTPIISANQIQQQANQVATHKAAVTLGIIMGTFLFCWVPFFCLNIIKALCVDCISGSLFRAFTWLGYANSALNPIIYGIHNSEFRQAFNRIFFKHLNIKNSRYYLAQPVRRLSRQQFNNNNNNNNINSSSTTTTTAANRSRVKSQQQQQHGPMT